MLLVCALALAPLPGWGAERLRVAAVFGTPVEEPWVWQVHTALARAQVELGIEYRWSEGVSAERYERVLREHAERGSDLLMGDAFPAELVVRQVARDYPGIAFVFGSNYGPAEPNFSVFDNWVHEAAYLAGLIAGATTRTGTIGVVAGKPIAEINRLSNAFCAGARSANARVECRVSFINSFFDPERARLNAHVLIDQGADVIYAERLGAIDAAAERHVRAIGNLSDQLALAPETVVTSVVWDMWPTVSRVIELLRSDVYTAQDFGQYSYMFKGGARLAPYHGFADRLPGALQQRVAATARDIVDGLLRVEIVEGVPGGTR